MARRPKSSSANAGNEENVAAAAKGVAREIKAQSAARTESYEFPEATLLARPEAGQQSRFRKKKPGATYRYDSSLAPEMNWDGQNPAREHGEWLIACIEDATKLTDANPPFTFREPRQFASADGHGARARRRD